jgi:hypothetical protein
MLYHVGLKTTRCDIKSRVVLLEGNRAWTCCSCRTAAFLLILLSLVGVQLGHHLNRDVLISEPGRARRLAGADRVKFGGTVMP